LNTAIARRRAIEVLMWMLAVTLVKEYMCGVIRY
jgi:hypothetical protein